MPEVEVTDAKAPEVLKELGHQKASERAKLSGIQGVYTCQIMKCVKGGYIVIVGSDTCAKSSLDEALSFVRESCSEHMGEPPTNVYGHDGLRRPMATQRPPIGGHDYEEPQREAVHRYHNYDDEGETYLEKLRYSNFGVALMAFGVTVGTFVIGNVLPALAKIPH